METNVAEIGFGQTFRYSSTNITVSGNNRTVLCDEAYLAYRRNYRRRMLTNVLSLGLCVFTLGMLFYTHSVVSATFLP